MPMSDSIDFSMQCSFVNINLVHRRLPLNGTGGAGILETQKLRQAEAILYLGIVAPRRFHEEIIMWYGLDLSAQPIYPFQHRNVHSHKP